MNGVVFTILFSIFTHFMARVMQTMENLQDIQKEIFQHRKGCYTIPECIYNIFKDNDEDKAYREARM